MVILRIEHRLHLWVEFSGLHPLELLFESIGELPRWRFCQLGSPSSSNVQKKHLMVVITYFACLAIPLCPATFIVALGNFAFKVNVNIFDAVSDD